jgi:hypothetical protein
MCRRVKSAAAPDTPMTTAIAAWVWGSSPAGEVE